MELKTAKRIVAKLNENDIEASLYEGYSGRAMFGDTTAGVSLDSHYNLEQAKRLCRGLTKCRQDQLGRGVILY
jgi:hypothetical protein